MAKNSKRVPQDENIVNRPEETLESIPPADPSDDLSIVAIGASAGGIEAVSELVRNLPADSGLAFVLIQHLDPTHRSILAELVGKETSMLVAEVKEGTEVEPNHIYVIPPNATMTLLGRTLRLAPRDGSGGGVHMPIDYFMRSLAESRGNRAIGVILSGSNSDGTLGAAEIQAQGGITFAQDENTAKYNAMPHSAIAAGYVDYVLTPKAISRELLRIAKHPFISRATSLGGGSLGAGSDVSLNVIFQLLRRSTGVDFTHYRLTTTVRRIQRRMLVHKLDRLEDYVKLLQSSSNEIKALHQDMLINVTSFFRNPKVFEALKTDVFPALVRHHPPEATIRVWSPGCASGEEPYSLAIALLEFLGDRAVQIPVQIFGTDVSEPSINRARAGFYPDNIQGDVSSERLRRFFNRVDGGFRISKGIRDMCIFAQHNVLSDPPFSQMNMISCRNLLIYLEPALQSKVISLFHYATRPEGFLLLGASEGVSTATNLFALQDRAHKIFSKKATAGRQVVTFSLNRQTDRTESGVARIPLRASDSSWTYVEAQKEFDRRLLTQYAPATAFINEDLEVIHTRGSVSRYLKLAPGRASLNILKMAREGLLLDLRNAIGRAKKDNSPVRKHGIQIRNGNGDSHAKETLNVDFEVLPVNTGTLNESYFMIVFQETPAGTAARPAARQRQANAREVEAASGRVAKLEQELGAVKEYLQAVIETQEATNEELQSANEEILSSNEELQSTNEELETAKEELQSANEELSTVNDELRSRNAEVTQINSDLTNLLSSMRMAVVIVGSDLTIRRFTPAAQKFLGVIAADVGRPLLNINPPIEIPHFQALVLEVMSTFQTVERELKDANGNRFQLRILPYRTADNKIDGAVITLMELADATK